jgi:hypothetical protein
VQLYFFDINDNETSMRDEIGLECDGTLDVQNSAIATLTQIAMEELTDGDQRQFVIRVRDGTGSYLFEARLSLEAKWLVPLSN